MVSDEPWDVPSARDSALPEFCSLLAELERLREVSNNIPVRFDDMPGMDRVRLVGWFCLGDVPLYHALPATWPAKFKTWVLDTTQKFSVEMTQDPSGRWLRSTRLASAADLDEFRQDYEVFTEELGLPPAPPGRVWFIRSPYANATAEDLLQRVCQRSSELSHRGTVSETSAFFQSAAALFAELNKA